MSDTSATTKLGIGLDPTVWTKYESDCGSEEMRKHNKSDIVFILYYPIVRHGGDVLESKSYKIEVPNTESGQESWCQVFYNYAKFYADDSSYSDTKVRMVVAKSDDNSKTIIIWSPYVGESDDDNIKKIKLTGDEHKFIKNIIEPAQPAEIVLENQKRSDTASTGSSKQTKKKKKKKKYSLPSTDGLTTFMPELALTLAGSLLVKGVFEGGKRLRYTATFTSTQRKISNIMNGDDSGARVNYLEEVLKIYTYPFLSKKTKSVITKVLTKPKLLQKVQQSMRLVSYGDYYNTKGIIESLWIRTPVYFGRPMTDSYNYAVMNRLFRYYVGLTTIKYIDTRLRYAVCGLAYTEDMDTIGVVHVGGVNFESTTTYDYKQFVDKKGNLIADKYSAMIERLVHCIYQSALALKTKEYRRVEVRLPMVGLGVFSINLTPADKLIAMGIFMRHVFRASAEYANDNLRVLLLAYDSTLYRSAAFRAAQKEFGSSDNGKRHVVAVKTGKVAGDIFNVNVTPGTLTVLVNAADQNSYIGNGGLRDNTIDGYLVAGHGPGAKLPNSSYLHNVFFMNHLLTPDSAWSKIDESKFV